MPLHPPSPSPPAPTARTPVEPTLPLRELLRCPVCVGELETHGDDLRCPRCARDFPVVLGIPDLRLYDDPLIPRLDDYRKGEKLQRAAESMSFAELVAHYWTLPTYPPTPPDLSARFIHHVLTDRERIEGWSEHLGSGDRLLDVGCGAGVLVRVAHERYKQAVGLDVGFRWLVIARRGLEEAGVAPRLVCACADHLPFADDTFDAVTSVALLEHVPSARETLGEFARVQKRAGRTIVWTSNRYSLAPEPHVRVWGVGFMPRRLMPAFVRWRRGLAYTGKTLLSRFELTRSARRSGFERADYYLPAVASTDLKYAPPIERQAARLYERVRRIALLRWPITIVFPALLAVFTGRAERRARA